MSATKTSSKPLKITHLNTGEYRAPCGANITGSIRHPAQRASGKITQVSCEACRAKWEKMADAAQDARLAGSMEDGSYYDGE